MRAASRRVGWGISLCASALVGMTLGWGEQPGGSISPEAQEAIKQLDSTDLYIQQLAFMRLEALREPATAAVVRRYVDSPKADTRAFSVRALAAIEGAAAVPVLVERLTQDRSPYVRLTALLALEPLQDPTVMPTVMKKLRDRRPEVRMAAVDVVSRIDDPQARQALRLRWRRERNRDVRRVLEAAMQRIGAE